jgi:hypothetical protein
MTTTLKQKLFLLFNKKKAVCVVVIQDTRKLLVDYAVPDPSNNVLINEQKRIITKDGYTLLNNIPTYFYKQDDPQPMPVNDKNSPAMSIDEYTAAINSKAVQDIFNAFEDGMPVSTLVKLGIGITVAAVAGAGYYMVTQLEPIIMKLDQIIEMLQVIGGGN